MEDNVILVSRYDEWSGNLSLIGIANCRFRAHFMISTDLETIGKEIIRQQVGICAHHLEQKEDVGLVIAEGHGLILTYTLTEIPMNTLVDVPKF